MSTRRIKPAKNHANLDSSERIPAQIVQNANERFDAGQYSPSPIQCIVNDPRAARNPEERELGFHHHTRGSSTVALTRKVRTPILETGIAVRKRALDLMC
jgi:hypothetical protein